MVLLRQQAVDPHAVLEIDAIVVRGACDKMCLVPQRRRRARHRPGCAADTLLGGLRMADKTEIQRTMRWHPPREGAEPLGVYGRDVPRPALGVQAAADA